MPVTTTTYPTVPPATSWTGGYPLIVDDPDPTGSGQTKALSLADLGDSTTATATVPGFTIANGTTNKVLFRYSIESEACCDPGIIYVDGIQKLNFKGVSGWTTVDTGSYGVGDHSVTYEFSKDSSASTGFDNMHISAMYVFDGDISNLTVNNLAVSNNGVDAFAYWASPFQGMSGFSFEWTIDNGVNVYSTAQNYVTLTGLTYNTTYTLRVRPVYSGYGNGAWTDIPVLLASMPKVMGSFRTEMWVKNSTQGYVAPDEVILSNSGSHVGTIVSQLTMPITESYFGFEAYVGSGADRVEMGVVSPSTAATAPGTGGWSSGLPSVTASWGFTGFTADIWNGLGVQAIINGVQVATNTSINLSNTLWSSYEVRYSIAATTLTMQLWRNGVMLMSASGTAPPYTMGRPVVAAGSGGIQALFKVRGTPTWTIVDLNFQVVQNITAYPLNDRVTYVWDRVGGATSYEYSLDGGTTPVSVGSNNYVKLTGLGASTSRSLSVRALSSTTSTQTGWSSPVASTTTATPTYNSFVIDKGAILCLPMDETSGNYKDISPSKQVFTPISELRGQTPMVQDSTQAVGAQASPRLGIARGSVVTGMDSTTASAEMWVRIPSTATNFEGSFFKVGDNNGWGVGVGAFGTQTNSGRTLISITEGVSWMSTSYNFTNSIARVFHLVITRNGSTFNHYIDGNLVATTTSASTPLAPTGQVHIGTTSGTPGRTITGGVQMDTVSFYPTTLSAAQILENFTAGVRMYQPTALEAVPISGGGVAVRWPAVPGATQYDVSTDGGSTFTTQAAAPYSTGAIEYNTVQLTGPIGTPISTVVRAKTPYNTSVWSSSATATPSSTRYVVHWDNFDRAPNASGPGSPQVGGAYTMVAGTWTIDANGRLYTPASADMRMTYPGSFNFDMTFQMPVAPNNNGGVIFRWTDANNYMMFYRSGNGETNSTYRLWRNVAGSTADIFSSMSGDPKITDTIRIIGTGPWIYVYINGTKYTYREDTRSLVGATPSTLGFYSWASPNLCFDNLVVWNTPDFDPMYPDNGSVAHVYKGRDNYNDDLGDTP